MKFNVAAAAASAAFLVGGVSADDQKVLKDESSVVESATKAAPELPTFTVSTQSSEAPAFRIQLLVTARVALERVNVSIILTRMHAAHQAQGSFP